MNMEFKASCAHWGQQLRFETDPGFQGGNSAEGLAKPSPGQPTDTFSLSECCGGREQMTVVGHDVTVTLVADEAQMKVV